MVKVKFTPELSDWQINDIINALFLVKNHKDFGGIRTVKNIEVNNNSIIVSDYDGKKVRALKDAYNKFLKSRAPA